MTTDDTPHPDLAHVLPVDDLIDHDTTTATGHQCICGPRVEEQQRPDGTSGLLFLHHPLHSRETGT